MFQKFIKYHVIVLINYLRNIGKGSRKKAMFNLQIIQTREFYYHFMKILKT